jgi:hypothetical protein
MSNQGRFGKYGELKRFGKLRNSNKSKTYLSAMFKQPLKYVSKHSFVRKTVDRVLRAGS